MRRVVVPFLIIFVISSLSAQDAMKRVEPVAPGSSSMMKAAPRATDPAAAPDPGPGPRAFDLGGLGPQVTLAAPGAPLPTPGRPVVLYFASPGSPTARATVADLRAHRSSLPPELRIVVLPFASAADLRARYGVTVDPTVVVLGASGARQRLWSGAATAADLVRAAGF